MALALVARGVVQIIDYTIHVYISSVLCQSRI